MPRPRKETDKEPKKRSRTGCWPCKARKVKCGEEKPACINCVKSGEQCDYSIRLNWGGRVKRDPTEHDVGSPLGGQSMFVANVVPTPIAPQKARSRQAPDVHIQQLSSVNAAAGQSPHAVGSPASQLDPSLTSANTTHTIPAQHTIPAWRHSPIITTTFDQNGNGFHWSPQHRHKRLKSSSIASPSAHGSPAEHGPDATYNTPPSLFPGTTPSFNFLTPISEILPHTPRTPDSIINRVPSRAHTPYAVGPNDLRRLSVRSLLTDSHEDYDRPQSSRVDGLGFRSCGYDHGTPDLDVPRNDDFAVLLPRSPDLRRSTVVGAALEDSTAEPDVPPIAFEPGGYYAEPVPVKIPRSLEPLPAELLDNPMNLLYFHHFINHTGRILVAHDCPENPFRGILPVMAVRNPQLLHLLLAFSASHRARLLGHPEPVNRIAQWMEDVLPALRQALTEPASMSSASSDMGDPTSLAPLATAIMLASLEVVSPSLSRFSIPWYSHLSMARRLIIATGGLDRLAQRADGARDCAIFFLSRWFAYLDVLGALSDCRLSVPLYDAYREDGGGAWLVNRHNEEVYQIDCLFGFSGRCIALLAQVAELANRCDHDRIDPQTNQARPDWQPSEIIRQQADDLERRLIASAATVYRGCSHHVNAPGSVPGEDATPQQTDEDVAEIYATNEAFHWAGLIQLSRRVLALPSTHPRVQDLVARTTRALEQVRKGSTAEGCLLYPSFSAGVEAQDPVTRAYYADRLQNTERWGIGNVQKARKVMQTAWETGTAWELLTEGEFLG